MFRVLVLCFMVLLSVNIACAAQPLPSSGEAPLRTDEQRVLPMHTHTADCDRTSSEPVQIICILDRSGSMRKLADDTINGYNSFIEKQRNAKGSAEVTTVLFDDKYDKIVEAANIKEVPEMTSEEYYARGMTALLDAIGRTIMDTAGRMEREGICPAKRTVLFMIMTDGMENNSKEYDKASVKALIEATTKDYHWNYIFMGANIDSIAEAGSIGISARHAVNYAHNSTGIAQTFDRMDEAAKEVRETGNVGQDWKEK